MIVHVRLRPGLDDDIAAWYEAQADKSDCVRQLIRSAIAQGNGNADAAALADVVGAVVQGAMGDLQAAVRAAVREALSSYRLARADETAGREDPSLAARLDAGLDQFFSED